MSGLQEAEGEGRDPMQLSSPPSSPRSPRHAPWIALIIQAMDASPSDFDPFTEPLALLLNALVVNPPSSFCPLLSHFLASCQPEPESRVFAVLANAVTLFIINSADDLDFTRARETQWYFAYLKDLRNAADALSQLVRISTQSNCISIRRRALKLLNLFLLGPNAAKTTAVMLDYHLPPLINEIQNLSYRFHVLTLNEVSSLCKIVRIFREITNQVRVNVNQTIRLITALIPGILAMLTAANHFRPFQHLEKYSALVRETLFLIARICGSDLACLDYLAKYMPTRPIIPFLDSHDATIVDAAWFCINWIIISDLSKIDFIRMGGAEKIFTELEKPVLVSRSVIYCTRKLAMLQETRRKLLEANALPVLLGFKRRNADIEAVFVTALTLSFLVLEQEHPWVSELERFSAREELAELTKKLYLTATSRSLGVLYVQLNHARILISSPIYESQCYGMWWVLHLLYGQKHGFYTRPYREMALRDRIIPVMFNIIKSTQAPTFLSQMAFETLSLLTEDPSLRIALIKANFFQIIKRCATPFAPAISSPKERRTNDNDMDVDNMSGTVDDSPLKLKARDKASDLAYSAGMAAVKNVFSDPRAFRNEPATTLKLKCENFLFDNTEKEDWLAAAELGHQHDFWQIKAYFMAKIFLAEKLSDFDFDSVVSPEFKEELQALAATKRSFAKFMYTQLKNALKGDNRAKLDVSTINSCLRLLIQIDDLTAAEELIEMVSAVGVPPSTETYALVRLVHGSRS